MLNEMKQLLLKDAFWSRFGVLYCDVCTSSRFEKNLGPRVKVKQTLKRPYTAGDL